MRNCSKFKEMMVELIYGEIDAAGERRLFSHLANCEECRQDLKELLEARNILSQMEKPAAPPPLTVIVERKNPIAWAAIVLIALLSLFIIGAQFRIKDTTVSFSTLKSSEIMDEFKYEMESRTYELEQRLQDAELYINELMEEIQTLKEIGGEQ